MIYMCVLVYSCFSKNHSIRSQLTTRLSRCGCYNCCLSPHFHNASVGITPLLLLGWLDARGASGVRTGATVAPAL
jgi:hypothetical protein